MPVPENGAPLSVRMRSGSLIEQLDAGHSDALTAYLDAMSCFHYYSFGKILELHGNVLRLPESRACMRGTCLAAA
jgi:hypothetical protein